jgi:uncharacterized DUF497 family protein
MGPAKYVPGKRCILTLYTERVRSAVKNWEQRHVTPEEAEDVFFHSPLVVRSDLRNSKSEKRYYALGQTGAGRLLFVSFTVRRTSFA